MTLSLVFALLLSSDAQPLTKTTTVPAERESPSEPATEAPPPGVQEGGPMTPFYQFSDFIDSRLTFILSNTNVFAGPGDRLTQTSGYRIGIDPNFVLFHENINTRFTGYESFSHLVLYKKLPGFWPMWETEAALAALVLANTDGNIGAGTFTFSDAGTYLRVIRKLGDGPEARVGSVDLTAWPVSADRFRLGYTYLISWGGTATWPGKLATKSITEGAVPGFRFRWRSPQGQSYAFLGGKSGLLLEHPKNPMSGEQVPNHAVLAGAGHTIEDMLSIEVNGGFFQKGIQERPGLEGRHINAYGVSGRVSLFQNLSNRELNDFRLYRNDPTDPVDYLVYRPYVPGTGYNISLEGNFLVQNLENPDLFGSEKLVYAPAGGLVAQAKLDELYLTLYGFLQSVDFILFNVPGFTPFQAVTSGAKLTPEIFGAAQVDYVMDEGRFRPSLSVGVRAPAQYKGPVPQNEGIPSVVAAAGEIRTQVIFIDTYRVVLPANTSAVPVFGSVLKLPYAISPGMVVSFETRLEIDNNQPRLATDINTGQTLTFFDSPFRLSFALLLQSRW